MPHAPDHDRVGVATWEAGTWVLTFAGATGRVRDSKGLRDLVVLLTDPGTAVHVSDLMIHDASGRAVVSSRGDEVLDRRAVAEFRRRLADLDDELAEAETHHDEGRVGKLATERQFLLDELAGAAGLGGRSRRMGDDVDRARKAVRARCVTRSPVSSRHIPSWAGTWPGRCRPGRSAPTILRSQVRWTVHR